MKKRILLFTLSAGIGILCFSSYRSGAARNGYDCTGAEAGGTGSFANPVGCNSGGCHGTSVTPTVQVTIELDSAGVPVNNYKAGQTYTVKLTGTNGTGSSLSQYGFQLAAMKDTVAAATVADGGTWSTTVPTSTHITAPGTYTMLTVIEQSSAITFSGTTFTQSFTWTAPVSGTGRISFWAVINMVNGNGNADAGDKYNTGHLVVNEIASGVGVATVSANGAVTAYPNPVTNLLQVSLDGVNAGSYTIAAFDLNGRNVATEAAAVVGGSFNKTINTAAWAPGVYQIVVNGNGFSKVLKVVKQ